MEDNVLDRWEDGIFAFNVATYVQCRRPRSEQTCSDRGASRAHFEA